MKDEKDHYKGYTLSRMKSFRFPDDDYKTLKKAIDIAEENGRTLNNHIVYSSTH